jgi:hypothetical protein
MLGWLKPAPVIDANSKQWLVDAFEWALRWGDAQVFFEKTPLVLPSPAFFPERSHSVQEMASNAFARVTDYASLQRWPLVLVAPDAFHELPALLPSQQIGPLRGDSVPPLGDIQLPLSYHPAQLNNPQAMIASLAQGMSFYLSSQFPEPPPGGDANLAQALDVLAVFLGFGVMMANTAYTFRGGCGSCYNPLATRQAALTELDTLYVLAIFCHLKAIDARQVKPHLKKHLYASFKKSLRDVQRDAALNQRLLPLRGIVEKVAVAEQPAIP